MAAILQRKRPWIRGKVAELSQLPPQRSRELVSGESFPYLGRHYRLKVQEGLPVGVCLSGGYLRATVRPDEQGEQRQARIQRYAHQIGVSPAGLSVRAFRSRWGSCDKRGRVIFNWAIIKAPHTIVEYVVIHGLWHLIHPNHSKAFWQLLARHHPACAAHRQWLKEQGDFAAMLPSAPAS